MGPSDSFVFVVFVDGLRGWFESYEFVQMVFPSTQGDE